jgi:tetratricopeptide (TPR) repeat protein
MNSLLLLAALVALGLCLAGVIVLLRRRAAARRAAEEADPDIIDAETQVRDGTTIAEVPPPPVRRPWYAPAQDRPTLVASLVLGALILLTVITGLTFGRGTPDRFVVLVAPFADGGDGLAGRNVASSLIDELDRASQGAIRASLAPSSPATPQEALELAGRAEADLLIWGEVEPGAMLDSPSLSPRLIYTPAGPYGPNGWDGYLGRFTMPRSFELAREPINGRAVAVPLVLALFDYANGAPDAAFAELGRLLTDYPALSGPLPHALRGNVLWARGLYTAAAEEYRLALREPTAEQALLANNLGAILLDANDPAALAAFQETVRLLDGRDLGELRYNLAGLALREGRNADAVADMEQARNLVTPAAPLLIDLTRAYRETGRLAEASATLAEAAERSRVDLANTASAYRPMASQRYDAALGEQRALLELATALGARGELLWELEVAAPGEANLLNDLRRQLDIAADNSETQVAGWRQRAATDGAIQGGGAGVSTGQAERAELGVDRQRFYQAVIDTELSRLQRGRPQSAFGALFGGRQVDSQIATLETLQRRYPENPQLATALGRARRILGDQDGADASFDAAVRLAPQAPEGYFGRGTVARARGDVPRAVELYRVALERNSRFFPAHYELAAIADELGDRAAAVAERRLINQLRPGPASAVALGQSLRLSGPENYVEAEQLLSPLAGSSADAAIELARLYNDAGRPEAAISAYQDALRIDQRSGVAAFELGETLVAREQFAEAERYLSLAVRVNPANVDARLALADLYRGPLGDPQRAATEYREALRTGVDTPADLEQIGDAALETGDYRQAIDALSRAVEIDPNSAVFRYKLGRAYLAAGRPDQAGEQAATALTLTGDPAQQAAIQTLLGDVARQRGDTPGATAAYNQALQLDPGQLSAQLGLGLVAVGQGNWGVASGYFQTAIGLPGGADDAEAQFWHAEALLRQGNLPGATAAYNRAIALRPSFPAAYLGLAQAQHALGGNENLNTALATVETAISQQPNYAEALLFKGKLLQQQGRINEAEAAYNASIRANNQLPEAAFRRGMIELQSSRYDEAARDFRRALQLQPNFPEAAYWLGRAYYAEGRLEPALQAFQQAVGLNGGYIDAVFYVGLVSEDLGRTAEAISAYQTVIAIDPNNELAGRARTQLDRLS